MNRPPFFAADPESSFRRTVTSALSTAVFGFLCVLAVGAVLLIGAKLQEPDLGAGASPASILNTIVLVSLGSTGAGVDIGDLTVQAVPLGGLLFVALGIGWAAGKSYGPYRSLPWIAAVATLFSAMCTLSALVCDIGNGADRIFVPPEQAFGASWLLGFFFALIRLPSSLSFKEVVKRLSLGRGTLLPGGLGVGINLGLATIAWGALLAALVTLGYALTRSSSLLAALGIGIHALVFLPNLAVGAVAFALGVPVQAGFGSLASTAGQGDSIPQYSLLDWNDGIAPFYMWLPSVLLLVGLVWAGTRLRRGSEYKPKWTFGPGIVLGFASTVSLVAGYAITKVAADLQSEGFLGFAVKREAMFGLALVWAAVGLGGGYLLDRMRDGSAQRESAD